MCVYCLFVSVLLFLFWKVVCHGSPFLCDSKSNMTEHQIWNQRSGINKHSEGCCYRSLSTWAQCCLAGTAFWCWCFFMSCWCWMLKVHWTLHRFVFCKLNFWSITADLFCAFFSTSLFGCPCSRIAKSNSLSYVLLKNSELEALLFAAGLLNLDSQVE